MLEYVNPEYLEDLARRVRAGDDLTEANRLALSDAVDQLDRLSRKAAIALRDQLIRAYCEKWHGRLSGARRCYCHYETDMAVYRKKCLIHPSHRTEYLWRRSGV